jgi:aquaporin Z
MRAAAMWEAIRGHWPEYLMEAAGLGIFMVSACVLAVVLEHPASPVRQAITEPTVRRGLMGIAMGLTAIAIVYSPWGKQSGAHLNPSITLTFFRLGKVRPWDAAFYALAQFVGGATGVVVAATVLGAAVAHPSVHYVVTVPGPHGPGVAFVAELLISLVLMTTVLTVSNDPRRARLTGLSAGALVALYITVEAPLSGMSMNPARTFASAVSGETWTAIWAYFTAPPLGMLLAAEIHTRVTAPGRVMCAKLHHQNDRRCIFRCGYAAARTAETVLREGVA